jgi:biotin carboxyl carrier protein
MKTQQTFLSPFNGKIAKLTVSKGEQVSEGVVMAVVEREEG